MRDHCPIRLTLLTDQSLEEVHNYVTSKHLDPSYTVKYTVWPSLALQEIWISIQGLFWTQEGCGPGRIQDSQGGSGQP